ncbi:DMT family transporter [Thalassorhabdomicrobium marinisediminis]|uniref:EamA/RhaT family transporter n=1 Tax=Thalassorhabdomicrobium marinisediminis TaxID=2170577 RepID=A0A2T7FX08_9RHOB|nr:DMT family transporter [Thalassorhabdomicrobium marinisediminis]PVA06668.1 EamA/RhaT family transporter [Thalassorhabdomicrobium marinisediminis]
MVAVPQTTFPRLSTLNTLGGMFVLGMADNLIAAISDTSSLWLFHLARTALALPLLVLLPVLGFGTLRARRPWHVLARNFFTATALLIYFGCLALLPIGIVVAGLFTAPIFVLIFSALFRAESVGFWRWGAVVMGFAGALLVVWPEEGGLTWLSVLPILAGVFYAIGAIGTRAWCEGEDAVVMTASYFLILGIYGAVGLVALTLWPVEAAAGADGWVQRGYVAPDLTMVWVTIAQAVGSILGVVLLTRGYQLGEASFVAINEYALIVFASFFAWLFWGQTLGMVALMGIALIILSGAIIALRSR